MSSSGISLATGRWRSGRGAVVATILISALLSFELFNFDTTRFALHDLLGGHRFLTVEWAAILAFAFCSIDFAGLMRMFTPAQSLRDESKEVWLLLGAWFLGAGLNAIMTWYAVALALAPRNSGAFLIIRPDMLAYAPVFVAILVWWTRILLIGSTAMAVDKLLHEAPTAGRSRRRRQPARTLGRTAVNNTESSVDFFED